MTASITPVTRLDDGVWLVRGLPEALSVLADDTFRAAKPEEFVRGYSRSFFLATDTGTPEDRSRFRAALAAAVSPQRMQRLKSKVMEPIARRLASSLSLVKEFDVLDDYVRPYTRQVSYDLAGVPNAVAVELAARLRVAADLVAEDETNPAARVLMAMAWAEVRGMAERGELGSNGIAGHALRRGIITVDEAALLTIPVLEMAVLDMSGALTHSALTAVSTMPAGPQSLLRDEQSCRAAVWEAARGLDDIFITRIATRSVSVAEVLVRPQDRILIDVPEANSDARVFPNGAEFDPARSAKHIAFGHGTHLCMGRELALGTAVIGLLALMERGVLGRLARSTAGTLRLFDRDSGRLERHG